MANTGEIIMQVDVHGAAVEISMSMTETQQLIDYLISCLQDIDINPTAGQCRWMQARVDVRLLPSANANIGYVNFITNVD